MGGSGSGRTAGMGLLRDKCHEYHSVDLAWLRRNGYLRTGYDGSITWSLAGNKTGWIQYRVESDGLWFSYRTRPRGGEWRDVDELIPFTYSATNFQGQRRWFLCPSCKRKCRILYGGSLFRCRCCQGLKYEGQYAPSYGRAATMCHQLRKKLGYSGALSDPFPTKPKGMHWRTYERLRRKDQILLNRWLAGMARWLEAGRKRG